MLSDHVFFHVVAFCDHATRRALGFAVERCIALKIPPAPIPLNSPFYARVTNMVRHKYCTRNGGRKYEVTFFDEANAVVVTVQPVWYTRDRHGRITYRQFSMRTVANVRPGDLFLKKRTLCGKQLLFDAGCKPIRGVNFCYLTGTTLYENVLPDIKTIDFVLK